MMQENHRVRTPRGTPNSQPSIPVSVAHSVFPALSLNVYEPLGTVYKKFIGSLRRVASLMLNVFSPSYAMIPTVSHAFERTGLPLREQRWHEREGEESLVNHYYTLLICNFKCGCLCFSLEMLHHDCGTAWSRMLIYFLIFPGLEIIIAGSARWPAREQEKLQAVVLAVPPWVKEANRNKPEKKAETKLLWRCERCLPGAARGAHFSACDRFEIASTEYRCFECTRHINFS